MNKLKTFLLEPFKFKMNVAIGDDEFIFNTLSSLEEDIRNRAFERFTLNEAVVFYTEQDLVPEFFMLSRDAVPVDVVAHEAFHITNMLFSCIGYERQQDNDELDAYLFQSIFNKINEVHSE